MPNSEVKYNKPAQNVGDKTLKEQERHIFLNVCFGPEMKFWNKALARGLPGTGIFSAGKTWRRITFI